MKNFENYTRPLLWFMVSMLLAVIAGCGSSTGSDRIAPVVSATVPAKSATAVALNANVTATFSEAMDASTITTATFTLKQGTTTVAGVVSYHGATATFNPTANLAASLVYTAAITTGAKDVAGNAVVAKTWTFTTGTTADTTAPTVSNSFPVDAATAVAINVNVTATFSEAIDASTITATSFTLKQGTTAVAGAVSYVGTTAIFNPSSDLLINKPYTATLTTEVIDLAGNAMASTKTWSFTTGAAADTTAPTVTSLIPLDTASGVATNTTLSAIFSEPMDLSTFDTTTFTLKQGTTDVAGVVAAPSTTTATFNPDSNLANNTVYTATITTGVKDLAGNAIAVAKTWSFTTVAAGGLGPMPVNLGLAGNFAVLAETLISSTSGTAITGDIGVSPAAATFIQGFSLVLDSGECFSLPSPVGMVTGKVYAADYNTLGCPTPSYMTTAVGDMMIAYNDAAGRKIPDHTEFGAGEIGGQTLAPGLYKWSSSVLVSTDVTLNGGANDVWIFQIAGDLTMANGKSMLLTGGALPKNIFWQVAGGTGVAIGTTAHFEGVILAAKGITVKTGATGNGRLLAQTAVTLDANAITQPAP